ncbi:hypothetical protein INR49_002028 [Caranx melampygus]|nr:hypothetical protein INR49_002028 [Caranx melampygus]
MQAEITSGQEGEDGKMRGEGNKRSMSRYPSSSAYTCKKLWRGWVFLNLLDYVQTSDELSFHVELGVGRPARICLEALTHLFILQNIKGVIIHLGAVQNLQYLPAEATFRGRLVALHEQHDWALVDDGLQPVLQGDSLGAGVLQLPRLCQLLHYVQSSHQLSVHIQLRVFNPCRTSSSDRISKLLNWMLCSFSRATICRLKPQRGSCEEPFMKSMHGAALISFLSRWFRSVVLLSASPAGLPVTAKRCTFLVSSGAWAPSKRSTFSPPLKKRKVGTEEISYFSDTSGTASASSFTNVVCAFSLASSAITSFIWPH